MYNYKSISISIKSSRLPLERGALGRFECALPPLVILITYVLIILIALILMVDSSAHFRPFLALDCLGDDRPRARDREERIVIHQALLYTLYFILFMLHFTRCARDREERIVIHQALPCTSDSSGSRAMVAGRLVLMGAVATAVR